MTDAEIVDGLTDVQALALTMWGEARGDAREGHSSLEERVAVGCVVRNRTKYPTRWRESLKGVCLQPAQFSCWNVSDPNRPALLATAHLLITGQPTKDALADETLYLAAGIASGVVRDTTAGATHYLTAELLGSSRRPAWSRTLRQVCAIGGHVFFVEPKEG